MLDFSWSELLVVLIVAILAIGPKQIPDILYHFGRIARRLQYMRYAVTRQFDDFMTDTELKQMGDDIAPLKNPPRILDRNFFDEAEADKEIDEALTRQVESDALRKDQRDE